MNSIDIIRDHTAYSFESIEILFDTFDEAAFGEEINGFPVWQQFYHLLNSIDRIFTDPVSYAYPAFHREGLNDLGTKQASSRDRATLHAYFADIMGRVTAYLQILQEKELCQKSNHATIAMTKFDHILAQLRHMAWHIGYLHACAKVKFGNTPEHILVRSR